MERPPSFLKVASRSPAYGRPDAAGTLLSEVQACFHCFNCLGAPAEGGAGVSSSDSFLLPELQSGSLLAVIGRESVIPGTVAALSS